MNRFDFPRPEPSFPGESAAVDPVAFFQLYDQYAPLLLGIITAIVSDESEAVRLLEVTFVKIRSRFGQARPLSQSLFIWLLSIARSTALESVDSKEKKISAVPSVFRLTNSGQVLTNSSNQTSFITTVGNIRPPVPSSSNALLDAVLFKNCIPEEAVLTTGLPAETARQQLRQAMQQLRGPQPARNS